MLRAKQLVARAASELGTTRAKAELGLALARMERTYALAVCRLDELDEYLDAVRARMRHAGYLASTAAPR